MTRTVRILSAGVDRPDERNVPDAERVGPAPYLAVDLGLKSGAVSLVRLTEDEALRLIADLSRAVLNARVGTR